jgi:hypothetical protein
MGFEIVIGGILQATGTPVAPIVFVGEAGIKFGEFSDAGSSFSNCQFLQSSLGVRGRNAPMFHSCMFDGTGIGVADRPDSLVIRKCTFGGGESYNLSFSRIGLLEFVGNQVVGRVSVSEVDVLRFNGNQIDAGTHIDTAHITLEASAGEINNNTLTAFHINGSFPGGLFGNRFEAKSFRISGCAAPWRRNDFRLDLSSTSIDVGILLNGAGPNCVLRDNNIVGSGAQYPSDVLLDAEHFKGVVVDAEMNWWGTDDAVQIETMIRHFADGGSHRPYVDYVPFRSELIPAPGDINGDGDLTIDDLREFDDCYTGVGIPWQGSCEGADFDLDGDVDCDDWTGITDLWASEFDDRAISERCDCDPFFIESSDPPNGWVDVRQDRSVTGVTPHGLDRVRITFNCRPTDAETGAELSVESFIIQSDGGAEPTALSTLPVNGDNRTYEIVLSDPIPSGAWTTIVVNAAGPFGQTITTGTGDRVSFGFLPGDIDGSGQSSPSDILWLIDCLNGVRGCGSDSCDVDRSGACGPPDILRLIDLLNGVNTTHAWLNVTLPPLP